MAGIENLHRPGLTPACGLRRAKVGFRFPTIPFLYYEYKIRNISIFYSLEFYFSQRAGEEKTYFPVFYGKIRGEIFV